MENTNNQFHIYANDWISIFCNCLKIFQKVNYLWAKKKIICGFDMLGLFQTSRYYRAKRARL